MANSDTAETALGCLKATGAIVECSSCGSEYIDAYDDDAVRRAHALAEELRKTGDRGFRGMTRAEVDSEIEAALDGIPATCPQCKTSL